jgi:pimeloyl-ACP methyl ester carboxylesterase
VLATCDAFDNYPPKLFRPLIAAVRVGMLTPLLASLKIRPARSLPSAYGWLTHHQPPYELIDEWIANYLADKGVRRDTRRLTAAMGDDAFMDQVAAELAGFTKLVLLAWAADDKHFPLEDARRLGAILPDARLELIHRSRTWVMRDHPNTPPTSSVGSPGAPPPKPPESQPSTTSRRTEAWSRRYTTGDRSPSARGWRPCSRRRWCHCSG